VEVSTNVGLVGQALLPVRVCGGRIKPDRQEYLSYQKRGRCFDQTCTCCTLVLDVEHSFTCPYCGAEISMVLDLSVRRQSYVEDCEVCCNPIEVSYTVRDNALADFNAKVLE
jgi:hypothetical protein